MSKRIYNVVLLPGDGIGPEVTHAAVSLLNAMSQTYGIALDHKTYEAGAELYRKTGISMANADMEALAEADAVLLGAMGLTSVRKPDGTEIAPQIDIRERFSLFAILRPCKLFPGVANACQSRKDRYAGHSRDHRRPVRRPSRRPGAQR